MLILFRPLKVGDYVDAAGHSGTVREVGLFMTELSTVDNVQIVIPNGDIWDGPIVNYSAHPDRRVDLVFGVSYDSDLKRAEEVLQAAIEADARIKHSPAEPFVAVTNLGDSSVDFTIRVLVRRQRLLGLEIPSAARCEGAVRRRWGVDPVPHHHHRQFGGVRGRVRAPVLSRRSGANAE